MQAWPPLQPSKCCAATASLFTLATFGHRHWLATDRDWPQTETGHRAAQGRHTDLDDGGKNYQAKRKALWLIISNSRRRSSPI